jgi:hypothetical protein
MSSSEDREDLSDLERRVQRHDVAALEAASDDARRVLDHQIATINDVDDKASDTIRYCILFFSLVLAAGTLSVQSRLARWTLTLPRPALLAVGIAGLLLVLGMAAILHAADEAVEAYTNTTMSVGPSDLLGDLDERAYSHEEWLYLFVYNAHDSWIPANAERNAADAETLEAGLRSFQRGMKLVFAAVLIYLTAVAGHEASEVLW